MSKLGRFSPHTAGTSACVRVLAGILALCLGVLAADEPGSSGRTSIPPLPSECHALGSSSPSLAKLLEQASVHPTAAAYNDLGKLYAQGQEQTCAIASFEAAIGLDPGFWEPRYGLALALIRTGDNVKAAEQLQIVLQQKADSFQAHNAMGVALQNLGQAESAAAEFEAALKANPAFVDAYFNLAQNFSDRKKYAAAIYSLEKALTLNVPRELTYRFRLALATNQGASGSPEEAGATLRALAADFPESSDVHFELATVYTNEERYSEAAAEYKEALRLDPDDDVARLSLAKTLLLLRRTEDALPYAQAYVKSHPADADGYYVLGLAFKAQGNFAESTGALQRAAEINPNDYDVRYHLGSALARSGQDAEAIKQLRAAAQLRPEASEPHFELWRVLRRAGDVTEAADELKTSELLKQKAGQIERAGLLTPKGNQLLQAGDARGAVEAYREALKLNPQNAKIHYNLSLALSKLGDLAGEKKELEESVKLDRSYAPAHNRLGALYMAGGKRLEAERFFQTAIALDPQSYEAENNLGVLYVQEGKYQEGAEMFRKAIESNPQFTEGHINLAFVLIDGGQLPQAREQLEKATQLSPGNVKALTALGIVEGELGDYENAMKRFQKAVTLEPNSPEAHLNLGLLLAKHFSMTQALAEFSEAARLDPKSAIAHFNKGRALFALGQRKEAREELEAACRLQVDYTEAQHLLALIEKQDNHVAH